MVRKFKIVALAGALLMAASPAFAQDPLADITKSLGDLDPTHILSPAPAAAPAAAPATKKVRHRRVARKKVGKKVVARKAVAKKAVAKKKK